MIEIKQNPTSSGVGFCLINTTINLNLFLFTFSVKKLSAFSINISNKDYKALSVHNL